MLLVTMIVGALGGRSPPTDLAVRSVDLTNDQSSIAICRSDLEF